jgi:hypothetical protein
MEKIIEHDIIKLRRVTKGTFSDLFSDVNNWSQFNKKLISIANSEVGKNFGGGKYSSYSPGEEEIDGALPAVNMFVGQMFEMLIEILYKVRPMDPDLGGISKYRPATTKITNDNGVDAYGKNLNDEDSVIQIKYKYNPESSLTNNKNHLSNMAVQGPMDFGVKGGFEGEEPAIKKYFVVTSGKGLHRYTNEEYFRGHVYCVGIKTLRQKMNHVSFWNQAREMVNKSIESYYGKKSLSYI